MKFQLNSRGRKSSTTPWVALGNGVKQLHRPEEGVSSSSYYMDLFDHMPSTSSRSQLCMKMEKSALLAGRNAWCFVVFFLFLCARVLRSRTEDTIIRERVVCTTCYYWLEGLYYCSSLLFSYLFSLLPAARSAAPHTDSIIVV